MSPELIYFVIGVVSGLISGFFAGIYFIMIRIRKKFDGFQGLQETLQEYFKGAQVIDNAAGQLDGDGCTLPDSDKNKKEDDVDEFGFHKRADSRDHRDDIDHGDSHNATESSTAVRRERKWIPPQ